MGRVGELLRGRYLLVEPIGSGGMGTVWRAQDTVLGRDVAVKEVTFPAGTRPEEVAVLGERTRREARAAARLSHPNAVTVFDVLEEDGRPWLVMELVPSRTLAQAVQDGGPLDPRHAAQVGLDVLGALEAAHARGILHRDVKPSNVLLAASEDGRRERAVLTDFGIATSTGDPSLTSSGLLLGSPSYIAPERAQGRPAQPASDLWALGATLFTAVEGRPPYDAGDAVLTVTAVVTGEPAPYVRAAGLEPVLTGLLEKDPQRRLSAAAARALLEGVAHAPAPAPAAPPQERTRLLPVPPSLPTAHATVLPVPAVPPADGAPVVTAPVPRPVRPAGRQRRTPLLVVTGVVAAAAVAGVGVALSHAGHDTATSSGSRATPTGTSPAPTTAAPAVAPTGAATAATTPRRTTAPTTAPAAPPSATTGAPADPSAVDRAVPAGWAVHRDGAAVPPGWTAGTYGGSPEYRDPVTGAVLRVSTGPGQADAVADRQRQARSFAAAHPSYAEIGIRPVAYQGTQAADWEFTYEGLHVLDRVFVAGGQGWSLYVQAPAASWQSVAPVAQQLFAAFRPPGG